MDGNPDLYGPIWITTSVVLILFLSSTIQGYLASSNDIPYRYNFGLLTGMFHKILLYLQNFSHCPPIAAAGLMYVYTVFIPLALWGALKWYGSDAASLLECICLYGYANLIWVLIAIASASPLGSMIVLRNMTSALYKANLCHPQSSTGYW